VTEQDAKQVSKPRWRRRALWVLGGIAAALFIASFAAPAIIRGPRFARLIQSTLPPMRGTVEFKSGSIGVGALWALVFGRPIPVHIDDLRILDPEGTVVFSSTRLSTGVRFERSPLRLTLHDLRPGKGTWRFARMKNRRGIGFLAAFLPARPPRPPGAGGAGGQPTTPSTPAPSPQRPRSLLAFVLDGARLEGLDVTFDFPGWGLALKDVHARGSLHLDPANEDAPLRFDVRDIDARRGGQLRILGGRRATQIPFDRAALARVGTPAEAPTSLVLDVTAAMTGPSRLSGRAEFPGLFIGRYTPGGPQPGLVVDATWDKAGPGLTAAAASRGITGLVVSGDNARVHAVARSSFFDIKSTFVASGIDASYRGFRVKDFGVDLALDGPPARVALEKLHFTAPEGGSVEGSGALDPSGEGRFDLRLNELATEQMLSPPLRPLLGGRAQGQLSLRGHLGESRLAITGIDVRLDRNRRGPLPRRFRISGDGATLPASAPSSARLDAHPDQLLLRLGRTAYEEGTLRVAMLRGAMLGARLRAGPLAMSLRDAAGRPLTTPRLTFDLAAENLDLRRLMPGSGLSGVLNLSASTQGPLDDVAVNVRFPAATTVTVFDQPYQLPRVAKLLVQNGDELSLPLFSLGAPGGGSVAVVGSAVADRSVDLTVIAHQHRLDRVPFVSSVLPSLAGTLSGRLRLFGPSLAPQLEGSVDLTSVALAGVALGEGKVKLTALAPGNSAFKGEMFRDLAIAGSLRTGVGGPSFSAAIDAKQLTLDPFLPRMPMLGGTRLRVGGRLTLEALPGRPLDVAAALDSVLLAYGCRTPTGDVRGPGCLVLESQGPLVARTHGGIGTAELERARFVAPGSDFSLMGRWAGGQMDARLTGRLGFDLVTPLLSGLPGRLVQASGAVTTTLTAAGRLSAPILTGDFEVADPLRLRSRLFNFDFLIKRGRVAFSPGRLSTPGVMLEALGMKLALAGEARMPVVSKPAPKTLGDRSGPTTLTTRPPDTAAADPTLQMAFSGSVDAGVLPRLLPTQIANARGQLAVEGTIAGTLSRPLLDGKATLGSINLDLAPRPTLPRNVKVAISGGQIIARRSRITIRDVIAEADPGGRLVIGPSAHPATLDLERLSPLQFGRVDIPIVGRRLNLDVGWLRLDDGSFDLTLAGDAIRGPLTLRGEISIDAGRVKPGQRPRSAPAPQRPPPRPPTRATRPSGTPVALDVHVKSNGERFIVDPGWLPDLKLDVDVKVGGTLAQPKIVWEADGRGVYSSIVLFLIRLFT
jgi:hypothetical protein